MEGVKNKIEHVIGSVELIGLICPLWEKLNKHHEEKSKHFKDKFSKFTFEERKDILMEKFENGDVRVEIAKSRGTIIGYCISSVLNNGRGEVESIFIESEYRGYGIGQELMENALNWFDRKSAKMKKIVVAAGNEDVIKYYEKYGFFTEYITLRQV